MTRRDTIISATLVNAGLLVILFVCALGIDKPLSNANAHASFAPSIQAVAESFVPSADPSTDPSLSSSSAQASQEILANQSLQTLDSNKELVQLPVHEESKNTPVYIVQKGDRLENLARENKTTVEKLVEINKLASTQLVIGQKLELPLLKVESPVSTKAPLVSKSSDEPKKEIKKISTPSKSPSSSTKISESAHFHYVQRGESPWVIAKKYNLSVDKLLKLNHLDEATARRLREGDRLRVR